MGRVQRVSVVGVSGSGKSTFATALADRLAVPHLELDSVYHQAEWTHLEPDEFQAAIAPTLAEPAWVIDGNYSEVQPLVWARADTVIWLDLDRPIVMRKAGNRFSKPKWKVEWKIDGNNFPLGRLGIAKIVGKIAHWLSWKWNFLSTPKNSEWKIGKTERASTEGSKARPQPPDTSLLDKPAVAHRLSQASPPGWKNSGRKLN